MDSQAIITRDLANLVLDDLAQRKHCFSQCLGADSMQEIALVLVLVRGFE